MRSQLWSFPVVHVLTVLITRFYFLNFSNIILSISQYTAYGCSTSFPTLPLKTCCSEERWDILFPGNAAHCEFTNVLGANNIIYIYYKVGLFQIMWFHILDVKECMHCVLTP
jgi:hypothetical protein